MSYSQAKYKYIYIYIYIKEEEKKENLYRTWRVIMMTIQENGAQCDEY